MRKSQVTHGFIVRLEETDQGRLITVQDLKTGERLEFESWEELARCLHLKTFGIPENLKTQ
ncbi:MAG: hypothetical protein KC422_17825 [Trueperaceae bacterium]|nr:hypothetical protein [Trueperaceae bacterium]